jgi:uncharacterized repeat protein (TIGR01451 family)
MAHEMASPVVVNPFSHRCERREAPELEKRLTDTKETHMSSFRSIQQTLSVGLSAMAGLAGCCSHSSQTMKEPAQPTVVATAAVKPAPVTRPSQACDWPTKRSGGDIVWTSKAFPTGDAATSILGIEQGAPREVRPGQEFTTEIIVTNLSTVELADVLVTSDANDSFKFARSTPEGQAHGTGVMAWDVGELRPCQSKSVKVIGTPVGESTINTCVGVTYSSPTTLCADIPISAPRLAIVMTGPAEVLACEKIVYTLDVKNAGNAAINNVKVPLELPEGLTTADGERATEVVVGTLAPGQSKKVTVEAMAAEAGRYETAARVLGGGASADARAVSTVVRRPDLEVEVESADEDVLIGREVTYRVTVKSTGDTASSDTNLTLNAPAGLTFVSADNGGAASTGGVTWKLGSIAPNTSRTVQAVMRSSSAGDLRATASATARCVDPVTDFVVVAVKGAPDIGTSISDDTGVRAVGENHQFTYTVKNQGQIALTNVTLAARLTDGLTFASSTASVQAKVDGQDVIWNLGTLQPGQEIKFTISVKGTAGGEQGIGTTTKCDQLQREVRNDEQVTYVTK